MSAYAYRRYRPPARYRYRGYRKPGSDKAAIAICAAFVLAAAGAGTKAAGAARHGSAGGSSAAAAQAIAYARSELGKPYLWGGTGPDAFDCSGLVMMAYRSAGVTIARTTFDQWKTEPHVSSPEPGDLVFFAGSDGTMTSPGHVGLVIGGGKMIQALGTGYPVMVSSWHRADLVGFTDPAGLAPVAAAITIPGGDSYTPASWASALLTAGGWPRTACNLAAVTAWERAEGGHWANAARFNPLNTTRPEPGSRAMNSAAVQAYQSWASGFRATLATLRNGNYPAVVSALAAGDSASAVTSAVTSSSWGTGPFTASC